MNLSRLVPRPRFLPQFATWSALRDLRIGITGDRGVLGSLLKERLFNVDIQAVTFSGDVADAKSISRWIKATRPDIMFHLAAIVPIRKVEANPADAMRVNATSLLPLSEALARFAPDSWVFLGSTSHVYHAHANSGTARLHLSEASATSPMSLYGATKLAGEQIMVPLAKHFGTRLCVGRIFSYFHERQPPAFLVPNLAGRIQHAKQGETIDVRDADAIRDFLHADMVVDAMLHLCARRFEGTINIASGRAIRIGAMAERLVVLSGRDVQIKHIPSDRVTRLVADVRRFRLIMAAPGSA